MRQYAKAVNFAELYIELLRVNLKISGLLKCTASSDTMFHGRKPNSRDIVGIGSCGFGGFWSEVTSITPGYTCLAEPVCLSAVLHRPSLRVIMFQPMLGPWTAEF